MDTGRGTSSNASNRGRDAAKLWGSGEWGLRSRP